MAISNRLRDTDLAKPFSSVEFGQRSQNNRLLAGLSPEALSLLRKHLREEEPKAGAPLWQVGHPVEYIYFPVCGMIFDRRTDRRRPPCRSCDRWARGRCWILDRVGHAARGNAGRDPYLGPVLAYRVRCVR
jgi:hypothetical protein